MADPLILAKAAAVLSDERTRKSAGWIAAAVLSPVIVVVALLLALGTGAADQNNTVVRLCFYGGDIPEEIPAEYRTYIGEMRTGLELLEGYIEEINGQTESGNSLDGARVRAVFYALYFGEDSPGGKACKAFADCFVTYETRTRTVTAENEDGSETETTETYTVAVPVSTERAYEDLAALLGREVTEADRSNADHIYAMLTGAGSGGAYPGGGYSVDLDAAAFTDPTEKNAADLVAYAVHAWESGWGYVWGTYGEVLTEQRFAASLAQYPDNVGRFRDFIQTHWLGRRTTDCVGLIKGYGWLDPETMTIRYGTNGMPDIGADRMYRSAAVSGPISTIPEIPGLAVWHSGHIGVYIGNGEVIEAMGTKYGVVKTRLSERHWTHWLKIPYIRYD